MLLRYNNVKISGISVCVPKEVVENIEFGKTVFNSEELLKTIESISVHRRHIAPKSICTSDLCYHAAKDLLVNLEVNPDEIDAVIFISQTSDYHLPATACILQDKLGIRKCSLAFDVNLGCSGYIYGLSLAMGLLNQSAIKKILILVGDTISKLVSEFDRSSCLLFGDAGSASLVESCPSSPVVFSSLNTDGSGAQSLIIQGGGYRTQSSMDTLKITESSDKNGRSLENLHMDGPEIFNFTIREIPRDIRALLEYAEVPIDSIDYFFFHQANKFMIDFLAKKLKIPSQKYPLSLYDFGNTSSASIPLTMASHEKSFTLNGRTIVLSGFGVGLSWGTVLMKLIDCNILPIKYI
jgi:3-oxoacyl-[acyl-carrier-protein] synthase III